MSKKKETTVAVLLFGEAVEFARKGKVRQAELAYRRAASLFAQKGAVGNQFSCVLNVGDLLLGQGQLDEACQSFEVAVELAEELDDDRRRGLAVGRMAMVHQNVPDVEAAIRGYYKAIGLLEKANDLGGMAKHLGHLGEVKFLAGDHVKALECWMQALEVFGEIEDRGGCAEVLLALGDLARAKGNAEEAKEAYQNAFVLYGQLEDGKNQAASLRNIGHAHRLAGEPESALDCYSSAAELYRKREDPMGEAGALVDLGNLAKAMGEVKASWDYLVAALGLFTNLQLDMGRAGALTNMASLAHGWGREEEAKNYLKEAISIYQEKAKPLEEKLAYLNLALLQKDEGKFAEARSKLVECKEVFQQLGHAYGEGAALANIALLDVVAGDLVAAEEVISASARIFQRGGHQVGAALAKLVLCELRAKRGHYREALDGLLEIEQTVRANFDRIGEGEVLLARGLVLESFGVLEDARAALGAACAIFETLELPLRVGAARVGMAELWCKGVQTQGWDTHIASQQAQETYHYLNNQGGNRPLVMVPALWVLADGLRLAGKPEEAAPYLERARAMALELGWPSAQGQVLWRMARVAADMGHRVQAQELYQDACDLLRNAGEQALYVAVEAERMLERGD